jgi:rare lipoprotein A
LKSPIPAKFYILLICLFTIGCLGIYSPGPRVQYGYATWYGKEFHGRSTASGEIYDMYSLTAAHRTLSFNTWVRVTDLENRRSVVVRINDRGPVPKKYIIDLSYEAARRIGLVEKGVARVKIEVLP